MRTLGKIMQIVGLIMLPVACLAQLSDGLARHFGLSDMVLWSVFGVASFLLGRYVEGFAASS
ncbi:MAG TPA: hypothetical protein VL096_19470 [Pirellulaceae bacterium]|nr:hypothetical protein [Pirellulaceae bacterium]